MRAGIRVVAPVVALVVLIVAACQPPKAPAGPAPGSLVARYLTLFGGIVVSDGFRSTGPTAFSLPAGGTAAQLLAPDGSVALGIDGTNQSTLDGFQTHPFPLGDLASVRVQLATGSDVRIYLLLDVNGDGDFLDWNAGGELLGDGGDRVATPIVDAGDGGTAGGTTATVGGTTEFNVCGLALCALMPEQLDDLKAGTVMNVDSDTLAAILVALVIPAGPFPADEVVLVSSAKVNGIELLVP